MNHGGIQITKHMFKNNPQNEFVFVLLEKKLQNSDLYFISLFYIPRNNDRISELISADEMMYEFINILSLFFTILKKTYPTYPILTCVSCMCLIHDKLMCMYQNQLVYMSEM